MTNHVVERLTHRLTQARLSRRAVLATAFFARFGSVARAQTPESATPIAAAKSPLELPQPQVLKSVNGTLDLTTTAQPAVVDMGAGHPVSTYAFDGVVPGYTWELNPGDTLRVNLVNNLPPLSHAEPVDLTRPHEWTTTNLHFHGFHVSPSGNADNIFLEVPPGASQQYDVPIPADHPGGLFWWHPHRHGAVAQQVRAGMAGAIIVRGAIDDVPEVRAAKEQVMVLQAIELGDDFQLLDPIPNPTKEQAFYPRTQILYTVNGVMNPKITMYPGEVQRWRMLNAAEGKFMSLRLEGHDFHILAWDGLTMAAPEQAELALLSSGNRVEALVKAGQPGTYELILTPGSSQKPNIPGMPLPVATPAPAGTPEMNTHETAPGMLQPSKELAVRSILTVEVVGEGPEMALPATLPAWDPPTPPIARRRQVEYSVNRDPGDEFIEFGIDDQAFDPGREPYQAKLGTAEEWTVTNGVDHKLADHAHVFHIHVNPFKITAINGRTLDTPLWRDTFVLTGKTGDSITFETHFADFTGKFVEHCHVLTHEDLGMMEAIEVIP